MWKFRSYLIPVLESFKEILMEKSGQGYSLMWIINIYDSHFLYVFLHENYYEMF